MKSDNLYTIGELSKVCNLPVSALRHYDKMGILRPAYVDKETNYRYYDDDSFVTATVLHAFKFYGCSLKNAKSLLESEDLESLHDLMLKKTEEFEEQIRVAHMSKAFFEEWAKLLEEAETVLKREQQPIRICEVNVPDLICWKPRIHPRTRLKHILAYVEGICGGPMAFTQGPLYNRFPSYRLRLEDDLRGVSSYIGCHPLDRTPIERCVLRETAVVAAYHTGGFGSIGKTYEKMIHWAELHNFELRGDCIERYVTDFWSTDREDLYVTEIFLPLRSSF